MLRFLIASHFVLTAAISLAGNALIRLTSFPGISVADGRSTVTINAEVRDQNGKSVPDGTQVVFSTSLGSFRESIVPTVSGYARATLVAGSIPGTSKITASALAFNSTSTLEFEFVGDRSLLSSAKEYVEIVAGGYLMYGVDQRTIGAAGVDEAVNLRYRDITIEAKDLQLNVPTYEVRARKATLTIGRFTQKFDELYLKLNSRKGFGTTTYTTSVPAIEPYGDSFRLVPEERTRYGVVEVRSTGIQPAVETPDQRLFEFIDVEDSATVISAKKATAFPRKEIQFTKADVFVGGAKVLKMPLFSLNLLGATPLLTDQIVNVNNNTLAVNYPHYLSLRPGETSLLRFRTGEAFGRGTSASKGAFLDYEFNWNRGDEMEGGFAVRGISRNDWSVGARQYLRIDDRTTANAQIEMPANTSLFGSGAMSRQFNGFQVSLSGASTRTLRGPKFESEQVSLVAEKDPTKVGKLPLRLYYGITATQNSARTFNDSRDQSAIGLRSRLQLSPIPLDKATTLNASLLLSKLTGRNTPSGLSTLASTTLSRRFNSAASLAVTYDFTDDGVNGTLLGHHRLSGQGSYWAGRTSLSIYGARSLDVKRENYFVDASYRLGPLWRASYSYTYDRYLSQNYLEQVFVLGYRLGFRELGLSFNTRTKRIGILILGASVN